MTRLGYAPAATLLAVILMLAAWGFPPTARDFRAPSKTPDYEAIVAAPDRIDADRQTDQRRQPVKLLASPAPDQE
jgi:predicted methyltransferase